MHKTAYDEKGKKHTLLLEESLSYNIAGHIFTFRRTHVLLIIGVRGNNSSVWIFYSHNCRADKNNRRQTRLMEQGKALSCGRSV